MTTVGSKINPCFFNIGYWLGPQRWPPKVMEKSLCTAAETGEKRWLG